MVIVPDTVAPSLGAVMATVGGVVSGGGEAAPPPVTSNASTTTFAPLEDGFWVPATSITSLWLPAASPAAVNITPEAAGRLAANVSTTPTRAPSRRTLAIPQSSQ